VNIVQVARFVGLTLAGEILIHFDDEFHEVVAFWATRGRGRWLLAFLRDLDRPRLLGRCE
jgi:hypothetical protein